MTVRCPVGCCHPKTGLAVEVEAVGRVCSRHYGKLSTGMASALSYARRTDTGLEKQLREAVTEARDNDDLWARFVVVDDTSVERFDVFGKAVERWHDLREDNPGAKLISGALGVELDRDMIRAWCPHRVLLPTGDLDAVGAGTSLRRAVDAARQRIREFGLLKALRVVNSWTDEELTWQAALDTLDRTEARGVS